MSANAFFLILAQCETHARRMLWAKRALQVELPLNAGRLRGLDDAQAAILNRAFSVADRLVEILWHVKGFAARYAHE